MRADGSRPALFELTSSSLNRPYGSSRDAHIPPLANEIYHIENFGVIDFNWSARSLALALDNLQGNRILARTITFDEIGLKN